MQIADLIAEASMRDYASQYTDLKEIKGEWWGISPLVWRKYLTLHPET